MGRMLPDYTLWYGLRSKGADLPGLLHSRSDFVTIHSFQLSIKNKIKIKSFLLPKAGKYGIITFVEAIYAKESGAFGRKSS